MFTEDDLHNYLSYVEDNYHFHSGGWYDKDADEPVKKSEMLAKFIQSLVPKVTTTISKNKNIIEVRDWDKLVQKVYGKPYSFQQQDGCQERGVFGIKIPDWEFAQEMEEEEMNFEIPLRINSEIMGVKFEIWLSTDPNTHKDLMGWQDWKLDLFWSRNFYPNIYCVANDLFKQGYIDEGEYLINIDW